MDWPCGQNPGRKPEGRQRGSAREAMSLGEQSSSCCRATLSLWHWPSERSCLPEGAGRRATIDRKVSGLLQVLDAIGE
jgi:hypothetical protein